MALTSASTYADATAQYRNSLRYFNPSLGSSAALSMAVDFVEAVLFMLTAPSASSFEGTDMAYRPDLWQKELEAARAFINATGGSSSSGGVRLASFANARS